jgi:hypothetical protein
MATGMSFQLPDNDREQLYDDPIFAAESSPTGCRTNTSQGDVPRLGMNSPMASIFF